MAYLSSMFAQILLRLLTLVALILSPVAMTASASARAPHHAKSVEVVAAPTDATGHCADMDKQSKDQPGPSTDCMMACAAMVPAPGAQLDVPGLLPASVEWLPLKSFPHGLEPEAATPPPRFS